MRRRRVRGGFPGGASRSHWRHARDPVWSHARRARRRLRFSAGEVRLILLAGVLAGLVLANADVSWTAGPAGKPLSAYGPAPLPASWVESARSAAILRAQERAPPSAVESERPASGSGTRWASGVRIVDGDTFWAGGAKVRIADIDTPEQRARCPREAALAARATARLGQLLAAGPFEMEPVGSQDEDRYGRKLRVVTRGGRSLGDQLVAEGLARTWTGRREPWC